ncbi:RnfH family protein [Xylophilus sp.]|uniref:RnfH family protein n=1 Tax=Xylophilus sp. TaxID=2653893 RepID=UPI0013BC38F4|nr:RnfH family protein [Xylophilus sp.]KAF1042613.1 MAG: hypothetical protein GAK38_04262 [Xylophilus sp.]
MVWSPVPRTVQERLVALPSGATVADALRASGLQAQSEAADAAASIWGRAAATGQPLRDGDRIELCRPLRVDPKVARRQRFRAQGSRAPGLCAHRDGPPRPAAAED